MVEKTPRELVVDHLLEQVETTSEWAFVGEPPSVTALMYALGELSGIVSSIRSLEPEE